MMRRSDRSRNSNQQGREKAVEELMANNRWRAIIGRNGLVKPVTILYGSTDIAFLVIVPTPTRGR